MTEVGLRMPSKTALADALDDVRGDILSGTTLIDALAESAVNYELNPLLLERKFAESYGSVEALRRTAKVTDARNASDDHTKIDARQERAIQLRCKGSGCERNGVRMVHVQGERFAIVAYLRERDWFHAVRMRDAADYVIPRAAKIHSIDAFGRISEKPIIIKIAEPKPSTATAGRSLMLRQLSAEEMEQRARALRTPRERGLNGPGVLENVEARPVLTRRGGG